MNYPEWLHPILRKVFSNMVNNEWAKAGRPILAPNVEEVECVISDNGWWLEPIDKKSWKQPKDGTRVIALILPAENETKEDGDA
jgi:hypothetical protein